MSRKELTAICIDTTNPMFTQSIDKEGQNKLEEAISIVSKILHERLIFSNKSAETGVFVNGDGFQSISPFKPVTVETIKSVRRQLSNLKAEDRQGSPLDAIKGYLKFFKDNKPKSGKPKNKLYILTSFDSPPQDHDDYDRMAYDLETYDIKVHIIIFEQKEPTKYHDQNLDFVRKVGKTKRVNLFSPPVAHFVYRFLRKKGIMNHVKFKGQLEISKDLRYPVTIYTKIVVNQLPSMKKYRIDPEDPEFRDQEITNERTFKQYDDDQPVDGSKIIKGFNYGNRIVPIQKELQQEIKVKGHKELIFLHFSPTRSVPRAYQLTKSDLVLCIGNNEAVLGFNALVEAMHQTKKIMVARFVMREGAYPKIAALSPEIGDNGFRCLYMNLLPTCEDIRVFPFKQLKKSTAEERELIEKLIDEYDLMKGTDISSNEPIEMCEPSLVFDPILQAYNNYIIQKGVYGQTKFQPLSQELTDEFYPEKVTHPKGKDTAAKIKEKFCFVVKETKQSQKGPQSKVYWKDHIEAQRELNQAGVSEEQERMLSKGKEAPGDPIFEKLEISQLHPITDFREMISNRKRDLTETAMAQMGELIIKFVEQSINQDYFSKAMVCLEELRQASINELEVALFNKYLRRLQKTIKSSLKSEFWRQVTKKGISLISSAECKISDVSEKESLAFLEDEEIEQSKKIKPESEEVDDLYEIE
jgi:ATP-dependent DNA helicase 2 subunit 2